MYSWVPASRIRKFGGSSMAAYLQIRADGQKPIRDAALVEKKTMTYPRWGQSGGGASEEPSPMRLLLAISLEEGEEARVFLGEEEGKESFGR